MCYPPTDENLAVAMSAAPAPASDGFARRGRLRALNGVYIDSSASLRYKRRGGVCKTKQSEDVTFA